MPEKPVPLREALTEAVKELLASHSALIVHSAPRSAHYDRRDQAEARVAILISQIPIVFEAREGDDG